jgi:prepilin-type processing-associated H-X9-DG protein
MATYTIIGANQKQYSLVTEANIRSWIAEGRLNEQSLIKAEGEAEFRPLADFPEFAETLAARTALEIAPSFLSGEAAAPPNTSRLAITSLVLGILGLITCGITAVVGLILGIIAMVKIKNSRGALGGGGFALAGIIVSAIFVLMIPIFAAMLLPACAGAKRAAQTINCISNVKRLAVAVRMYADNKQNHYPPATNWCDVLLQVDASLTNSFHCPADSSRSRCSYAFNAQLSGADAGKVDPNTVMIFEANGGWNVSGGKELLLANPRHGHVIIVSFADGHVEQVPESQQAQLRWNP